MQSIIAAEIWEDKMDVIQDNKDSCVN